MAKSRLKKLSDRALDLVASRFKLLSEPTRLKLIIALSEDEKRVSRLVEDVGGTQANISRQLQILAEGGILARRKDGLNVYYRLVDSAVFQLCDLVCGSLQGHLSQQVEAFKLESS